MSPTFILPMVLTTLTNFQLGCLLMDLYTGTLENLAMILYGNVLTMYADDSLISLMPKPKP